MLQISLTVRFFQNKQMLGYNFFSYNAQAVAS